MLALSLRESQQNCRKCWCKHRCKPWTTRQHDPAVRWCAWTRHRSRDEGGQKRRQKGPCQRRIACQGCCYRRRWRRRMKSSSGESRAWARVLHLHQDPRLAWRGRKSNQWAHQSLLWRRRRPPGWWRERVLHRWRGPQISKKNGWVSILGFDYGEWATISEYKLSQIVPHLEYLLLANWLFAY